MDNFILVDNVEFINSFMLLSFTVSHRMNVLVFIYVDDAEVVHAAVFLEAILTMYMTKLLAMNRFCIMYVFDKNKNTTMKKAKEDVISKQTHL